MTPKRSLFGAAALLTGAVSLVSFAHASPAAAQTSTRHTTTCVAMLSPGEYAEECQMSVPTGKVFVIESASVHGYHPSIQYVQVLLLTKAGGATRYHAVPAGFQVLTSSRTMWAGAVQGTIFSDAGQIVLSIYRGASSGNAWFEVTLSGRLEDL